jgi:hypothetical protein
MSTSRRFQNLHRGGELARGRGRVQRAARRATLTGDLITTADVLAIAYARRTLLRGRPLRPYDYWLATAALRLCAVRVRRAPTHGRPWLWRLRDTADE